MKVCLHVTFFTLLLLLLPLNYRPQTKFVKVMFLQVSVCPRGGGRAWQGACMAWWQRGACMAMGGMHGNGGMHRGMHGWGGMHGGGYAWHGGVHGMGVCMAGGMHGREACVAGGVHGRGAGGHVWLGGGTFPPWADTVAMAYGQWAGGMHPTGMHSC